MNKLVLLLTLAVFSGSNAWAMDQAQKDKVQACIEKHKGQVNAFAKEHGIEKKEVRNIDGLFLVMLIGQCGVDDEKALARTVQITKDKILAYAQAKQKGGTPRKESMSDAMMKAMMPGIINRMPAEKMFDEVNVVKAQSCDDKLKFLGILMLQKKVDFQEKADLELADKVTLLCKQKKFSEVAPMIEKLKKIVLGMKKPKTAGLDEQTLLALRMMKVGLPEKFEDIDVVKLQSCEPKQRMLGVLALENQVDMVEVKKLTKDLADKMQNLCRAKKFKEAVPVLDKMKEIMMGLVAKQK